MEGLRHRLPGVTSLLAFESAARHSSFSRAAEELGVTREAVSKQIRGLEKELEVALFDRVHRGLRLTPNGAELYRLVRRGLLDIADGVSRIRSGHPARRFTISATHAIASYWLVTPLRRFRSLFRDLEVQVVVSDDLLDLTRERIDISLRYGEGRWPEIEATPLCGGDSFPVCAPSYLEEVGPIERASDLLGHTLLVLDGPYHGSENWWWWLERAGIRSPQPARTLHFNTYNVLIQSALEGQGLALGFGGVIDEMLLQGRLVRPLTNSYSRGRGVYLVRPEGAAHRPETEAFMEIAQQHVRQQSDALAARAQTGR